MAEPEGAARPATLEECNAQFFAGLRDAEPVPEPVPESESKPAAPERRHKD